MIFRFMPFLIFDYDVPFGRERGTTQSNRSSQENDGTQGQSSSSWQIIMLALFPFILTTVTLGDFKDFVEFLPLLLLSLLTTRNWVSNFLTRTHPSLAIILAFAIPSFYQIGYMFWETDDIAGENYENNRITHNEIPVSKSANIVHNDVADMFDLFWSMIGMLISIGTLLLAISRDIMLLQRLPNWLTFFILRICTFFRIPLENRSPGSVPASAKAISEISRSTYLVTEADLLIESSPKIDCTVCLDELRLGNRAVKLGCGHIYHVECLLPWLKKHCTCPTCRFEIETDNFVYEFQRKQRQTSNRPTYIWQQAETKSTSQTQTQAKQTPRSCFISSGANVDYNKLSVKELKQLAKESNINIESVIEKKDLVEALTKIVKE